MTFIKLAYPANPSTSIIHICLKFTYRRRYTAVNLIKTFFNTSSSSTSFLLIQKKYTPTRHKGILALAGNRNTPCSFTLKNNIYKNFSFSHFFFAL